MIELIFQILSHQILYVVIAAIVGIVLFKHYYSYKAIELKEQIKNKQKGKYSLQTIRDKIEFAFDNPEFAFGKLTADKKKLEEQLQKAESEESKKILQGQINDINMQLKAISPMLRYPTATVFIRPFAIGAVDKAEKFAKGFAKNWGL